MLSIICPCHNSIKVLDRLFDSIMKFNIDNNVFEIIFIDDGSTDRTYSYLKEKQKKINRDVFDITVLKQTHKGPGAARNLGIRNSKYTYLGFMDSDDIWYDNKIKTCLDIIIKDNNKHNFFIHDEIYKRSNNSLYKINNGKMMINNISKSLYIRNCFSTSAVILHKSLLKDNLFDESLMSSQDYDLWLKISKDIKLLKIDSILGEYIETSDSISSKYYLYRFYDQIRIAIRYRGFVSTLQFYKKILKIILSKQWVYGIRNILSANKKHNY